LLAESPAALSQSEWLKMENVTRVSIKRLIFLSWTSIGGQIDMMNDEPSKKWWMTRELNKVYL